MITLSKNDNKIVLKGHFTKRLEIKRRLMKDQKLITALDGFSEYILSECGMDGSKQESHIISFLSHCESYLRKSLSSSRVFINEKYAREHMVKKIEPHQIKRLIKENVLETSEVVSLLKCSRQNIDYWVSKGKINPVKHSAANKLFLKSDVEKLAKDRAICAVVPK